MQFYNIYVYIIYIYPHYLSSHHIVAINNHIIYHPVDILSMSNMVTTEWLCAFRSEVGTVHPRG